MCTGACIPGGHVGEKQSSGSRNICSRRVKAMLDFSPGYSSCRLAGDSTIHRPEPTTSNASGLPRSPGA